MLIYSRSKCSLGSHHIYTNTIGQSAHNGTLANTANEQTCGESWVFLLHFMVNFGECPAPGFFECTVFSGL